MDVEEMLDACGEIEIAIKTNGIKTSDDLKVNKDMEGFIWYIASIVDDIEYAIAPARNYVHHKRIGDNPYQI